MNENVDEFLNTSSFSEDQKIKLSGDIDINVIQQMIDKAVDHAFARVVVEIKHLASFHMKSWVDEDYWGNKAIAEPLNEIVKSLSSWKEKPLPVERIVEVNTEYKIINASFKAKQERLRREADDKKKK